MIDHSRLPAPQRPPLPDFTPVPRQHKRHDGWTPERQRGFIAALAETGSVRSAAHAVNMAPEGAYYLRRHPEAGEFARASEVAQAMGVQSLADIAIDRARDGVAVPVFWKGEQVGEKRWYNDRLLMFILRHHLPRRYGANKAVGGGTKAPDTLARERKHAAAAEVEAQMEGLAKALSVFLQQHRLLVRRAWLARTAGDARLAAEQEHEARRIEQMFGTQQIVFWIEKAERLDLERRIMRPFEEWGEPPADEVEADDPRYCCGEDEWGEE